MKKRLRAYSTISVVSFLLLLAAACRTDGGGGDGGMMSMPTTEVDTLDEFIGGGGTPRDDLALRFTQTSVYDGTGPSREFVSRDTELQIENLTGAEISFSVKFDVLSVGFEPNGPVWSFCTTVRDLPPGETVSCGNVTDNRLLLQFYTLRDVVAGTAQSLSWCRSTFDISASVCE